MENESNSGIIYSKFRPAPVCHCITNTTTKEEIRRWNTEYYDFMEDYYRKGGNIY